MWHGKCCSTFINNLNVYGVLFVCNGFQIQDYSDDGLHERLTFVDDLLSLHHSVDNFRHCVNRLLWVIFGIV